MSEKYPTSKGDEQSKSTTEDDISLDKELLIAMQRLTAINEQEADAINPSDKVELSVMRDNQMRKIRELKSQIRKEKRLGAEKPPSFHVKLAQSDQNLELDQDIVESDQLEGVMLGVHTSTEEEQLKTPPEFSFSYGKYGAGNPEESRLDKLMRRLFRVPDE